MTVGPTGGISQTDFCVCVACVLFLFSHSAKSVNGLFSLDSHFFISSGNEFSLESKIGKIGTSLREHYVFSQSRM